MTHWVLDIETTTDQKSLRIGGIYGHLPSGVKSTRYFLDEETLYDALRFLESGDTVWTWNGSRFDFPVIKKILGLDFEQALLDRGIQHKDGILLAKLLFPDEPSYSLESFYLKVDKKAVLWKPDDPEWYNTVELDELISYLNEDLKATLRVITYLYDSDIYNHPSASWEHPLKVEQKVAEIIQRQVDEGVPFNIHGAERLFDKLSKVLSVHHDELNKHLPYIPIPPERLDFPPKKQFVKTGEVSSSLRRYCKRYGATLHEDDKFVVASDGSILTLPLTEPLQTEVKLSPGQTGAIKDYLLTLGWEPTAYNTVKDKVTGKHRNTSPLLADKITKEPCPNLKKLGIMWVNILTDYLQVKARMALLGGISGDKGLIALDKVNFYGDKIHSISSDADTCGTPTSRFKHRGIVNIPRVTTFAGAELRSLFTASPHMKLIGWDANSLEAAMEAHYVYPYDKNYAEMLISGDSKLGTDIHTMNWKTLGLKDRDAAKAFKYMLTYGAQPLKVSKVLGCSLTQAINYYEAFWKNNNGLLGFKMDLDNEWKLLNRKHVIGLDGRLIATRSGHSTLNSKLQGAGAVVMKHAMLIADGLLSKEFSRDEARGLIRMHDEEQWEALEEHAHRVGQIGVESVRLAGEYLKLNVPISATYKIGNNWAETH